MNKKDFLDALNRRLATLSAQEREKSLLYFSEMIDDRIEEGMSEEEAVSSLESLDDIVEKILTDALPYPEEIKDGRMRRPVPVWAVVLIVLGSPIWLALLLALLSVVFAALVCVFSLIAALFAVVFSLIAGGIVSIFGSLFVFYQNVPSGLFVLGGGCFLTGAGMLLLLPVYLLSKQLIRFAGWMLKGFKESWKKRRWRT